MLMSWVLFRLYLEGSNLSLSLSSHHVLPQLFLHNKKGCLSYSCTCSSKFNQGPQQNQQLGHDRGDGGSWCHMFSWSAAVLLMTGSDSVISVAAMSYLSCFSLPAVMSNCKFTLCWYRWQNTYGYGAVKKSFTDFFSVSHVSFISCSIDKCKYQTKINQAKHRMWFSYLDFFYFKPTRPCMTK